MTLHSAAEIRSWSLSSSRQSASLSRSALTSARRFSAQDLVAHANSQQTREVMTAQAARRPMAIFVLPLKIAAAARTEEITDAVETVIYALLLNIKSP